MAPLAHLIARLREGNNLIGTYHRRVVQEQAKIVFGNLVVRTVNGTDYVTTSPLESELFLN